MYMNQFYTLNQHQGINLIFRNIPTQSYGARFPIAVHYSFYSRANENLDNVIRLNKSQSFEIRFVGVSY